MGNGRTGPLPLSSSPALSLEKPGILIWQLTFMALATQQKRLDIGKGTTKKASLIVKLPIAHASFCEKVGSLCAPNRVDARLRSGVF
jgi:hypothetical protein